MPRLDDATIARLGHLNYFEFSRETVRQTGRAGELCESDGVLLCAASVDFPVLMNVVWRLEPSVGAADLVARSDAWFAAKHRGYSLNVRDGWAEDDDLRAAAEAAGLVSVLNAPEMVCRDRLDDHPVPNGSELRWVEDEVTFRDFIAVSDGAYSSIGLPAGLVSDAFTDPAALLEPYVHSVVAYADGQPAAAAQVILSHGISGVYWVGTVESARGRGLGEAVTRAVTNRAFDEGAAVVTLQASPMGEPIYLRMGYESLYRYSTLVRFEAASSRS
jgi:ribosomal protein S18 acetylase RimI-like enzyme